jgi:transcriptional regulator with PAS, ATPase and Fis domain
MYLFKNAIKSIVRAKTRNILVAVIALVITVSACVALSIRQSAETAKNATLDQMQITAQITVDRQAMMKAFQSGADRSNALQNIQSLSLEDLKKYAESQYVSNFYYTITSSFNADENVAPVDTTVSITGQSGTGKNVLAKEIHKLSKRKVGPFISINCAAIPEQLLESELFGYRRGAFTGAEKSGKVGLVELANNGTLFLDEI